MDKSIIENSKNTAVSNSKLQIENRSILTLSGISEVLTSNANNIIVLLNKSKTYIGGENLQITKLDIEKGEINLTGLINFVKFDKDKGNFFTRIFK